MRWLLFSGFGRQGRKTYLLGLAFWVAVLCIPVSMATQVEDGSAAQVLVGIGAVLTFLPTAWSIAMMSIKRLHDIGLSGLFVVALVVPGIALVALVGLSAWPSARRPNRFGPHADFPGY